MRQIPLNLEFLTAQGRDDFIISDCNRLAAGWIDRWPDWPGQFSALNIVGPPASGKSHLAAIWQQMSDASLYGMLPAGFSTDTLGAHIILDHPAPMAGWDEAALFHLFNHAVSHRLSILILSREPVARMRWHLPDLASRLRSVNVARLDRPDDALLRGLLEKYFADRQLAVDLSVLDYMVTRMERSFLAVHTIAAAMDKRSLAQRRSLTLPLAREIMAEFSDGAHARQQGLLDDGDDDLMRGA